MLQTYFKTRVNIYDIYKTYFQLTTFMKYLFPWYLRTKVRRYLRTFEGTKVHTKVPSYLRAKVTFSFVLESAAVNSNSP